MDVLSLPEPRTVAPRLLSGLAAGTAVVLLAAVALTALGGGLVDNVAADSAAGGSGLVLGALAEVMLAVLAVGCRKGLWPGRLGGVATVVGVVGLVGMVAGGIATAITGDHQALGVVYVAGALLSFAGFVLLAVAAWRAGRLPRPLMVLMAVAFLPLLPPVVALADVAALIWLAAVLRHAPRP
jgi:hypothetical protein